ncbi:hypothetical protein LIER_06036 [Lithospermum erythrorhizon]|uniref:Uncharacterized protein n=1 Tax=Lithospermum erythrorhizon TaxID=34254 RepID=A0AAV3P7L6_LITER
METEEDAKVFAANVFTEPDEEVRGSSKVPAKKRKMLRGEGPKRKPKKPKVPTVVEGAQGDKEAPAAEPGVKESQTLEGFRRNTAESIIAKGHLRHLRGHYSIHQKVLMRTSFEGLALCKFPPFFDRPSPVSIGARRLGYDYNLSSKEDKDLIPSKVNYKALVSGKSLMQQVMGSKVSVDVPSPPQVIVPSIEGKSTPSHQSKAYERS